MNYQESIIKSFKETFPHKTLKTISAETGIQMTRVFRIFNGAEMKLKEYEAFERILNRDKLRASRFDLFKKFQAALAGLAQTELDYLEIELNHILKIDRFINKPFLENLRSSNMAFAN